MGWIAGRAYRQKITVQEGNVFANLTDFPVAILITGSNEVFTKAQSDGYDILFANDAEEILSYERVRWNPGSQIFEFVVKSDLSSTEGTDIYMYYGNGGNTITSDGQDMGGTWDSDFDAVWHFEDGTYTGTANEVQDSSGNGNHGRANGGVQGFSGTWGQALNVVDSNDFARFESNLDIFAEYTISCLFWVPLSNSTSWHTLTRGSQYHQIILRSDHVLGNYQAGFHSSGFDMDTLSPGLHHVAVVRLSGGTGDFYVDGIFVGNAALQPQDDIYAVGNYQGNGQHWGQIDEFRVSASTGRSAGWLRTEYENLVNNSTFFVLSAEEDTPYLIEDIPTAITIYDNANFLDGTRNFLTEFTIGVESTVYYDMPTDISLADIVQTTSGTDDIDVELAVSASGLLTDAMLDTDIDFYVSSSGIFNTDVRNTVLDFTVGRQPVPITDPYGGVDVRNELGIGYIVTPSGVGEDIDVELGIGNIFDAETDLDVDFSIATSALFNYSTETYGSTYSGTAVLVTTGGWYNTNWEHRQEIVIDNSKIFDNHTDFPMAIKINGGNLLFSNTRTDGYDILFTESDGVTKLPHELVRFSKSSSIMVAYVKCDLSTAGSSFYIYYGNPAASDQSDKSNTWPSHYKGVYHFEEASGQLQDATSNARHSTTANNIKYQYDGLLSYSCYFDGSGDYFIIPTGLEITGNNTRTVTAYFYPVWRYDQMPSWSSLTRLGGDGSLRRAWMMSLDNASECSPSQSIGLHYWGSNTCTSERVVASGDEMLINTWHQYAGTHAGTTQRVFLNGTQRGTSGYTLNTLAGTTYIGGRGTGNYNGRIAEIRVSNTDLGANWIRTEYENMINNSAFFTLSDEESLTYRWELDDYIGTETSVSGGSIVPIVVDVFSSVSGTQYNIDGDLYVSLANTISGVLYGSSLLPLISGSYFSTETTTSGALSHPLETDLYVSLVNVIDTITVDGPVVSGSYFSSDMRTFALQIDNFFLDVDEYVTSTATMHVDITDKRKIPIDTANSYFIIDGVPVTSGIWFTPVDRPTASGYRMYYDPPGDFAADDSIEVIVHAENVINDFLEQTYYLLWGYNLIVNATELHSWGWDKEVIVWSTASNLARCPAESADAWHIRTAPKPTKDLAASIVPQVKHKDLSAVIYPISTAIFYDGTYKITVNLKDSAGNEMPPFTLEFTVEDKPN